MARILQMEGFLHAFPFSSVNKATVEDCYPLPLISDLLNSPALARTYTKIDLKHAFHLVQIAEGDEPKTAFCTHYGSPSDYPTHQQPSSDSLMKSLVTSWKSVLLGTLTTS